MSIRITELDAITSLQSGDYIAVDNESTGTHKFDALNIGANIGQNIANTYSSSASYAIGQYCLYDNNLYKCTTTISTPEAWNSSHWIQVTVGEGLYEKVDKVSGKGLSTNDFTNEYKQKLGGIEAGAEVNVQADWTENDSSKDDYIKNKPGNATTSASGFMSASDKQKLDNIEAGAEVNVQPNWAEDDSSKDDYIKNKPTIDTALSASSDNAVKNSAITAGINQVQGNLDTEITNRQNAVSGEQLARENADSALDGRLDTVEEILPNKANINGSYEEMTVGSAEQLISTELIEDSELYTFRISGGGIDIGNREIDKLVGGTVAWNQLVNETAFENGTVGLTVSLSSHRLTITGTTTGGSNYYLAQSGKKLNLVATHKYLICGFNKCVGMRLALYGGSSGSTYVLVLNPSDTAKAKIVSVTDSGDYLFYFNQGTTGTVVDIDCVPQIFDLTQMFGSTIADALYAMEQLENGSAIAWFKKYFPKPYYAYDSGSLQSVNVASHDMVGINQLYLPPYSENDYHSYSSILNPVVDVHNQTITVNCAGNGQSVIEIKQPYPSGTYTISLATSRFFPRFVVRGYDVNNTLLTNSVYSVDGLFWNSFYGGYYGNGSGRSFTVPDTVDHFTICIGITEDTAGTTVVISNAQLELGTTATEYEQYEKHNYPYDETVELRGMPSLADGELVYDGDTYEADGTVNRKYGYVDLGTLTWDTANANGQTYSVSLRELIRNGSATGGYGNQVISAMFVGAETPSMAGLLDGQMSVDSSGNLQICKTSFTSYTNEQLKTAMSGVYLVYELATQTSEQATGFANPQIVESFGTEEYVDAGVKNGTRDVSVPVGHVTQYMANLRDKLQHLPNIAKDDGNYLVNQTGRQMKLKKVEGYYEDLVSGMADNLTTKIRTNDQTPYLFRTAGGSVDIGDREYINGIVGGTVAWNQLYTDGDFANVGVWRTAKATLAVSNNIGTLTCDTAGGNVELYRTKSGIPIGHKFLFLHSFKSSIAIKKVLLSGFAVVNMDASYAPDTWYDLSVLTSVTADQITDLNYYATDAFAVGDTVQVRNTSLIDLTQMFGSTIADYIYSLEQANAGAGVAFFKTLFPKPYYAYNAGELKSVKGLVSHDMVGFNAWDEEWELGSLSANTGENEANATRIRSKNYVRVLPSTTYHFKTPKTLGLRFYDADKNFLGSSYNTTVSNDQPQYALYTMPANAHYLRFSVVDSTTYNHDICINLSWDGSEDGNYEPYQKWSYPLDSDLELRGIPKLDASNNLYYDGDTYESDGTVTRKYGVVDLGTLTWGYSGGSDVRFYSTGLINAKAVPSATVPNMMCGKLRPIKFEDFYANTTVDKTISYYTTGNYLFARDLSTTSPATFKASVSGVYLVYELAEPTTESADPYTNPQIVNDFGTEEFVIDDAIDVPIPVGHNTDYPINLKSKLEMAPDSPDGDGDYIVRQTNGTNEYVPLIIEDQLPAVPSTDGTYTLTVTIASGEATYSWT